MSDTESKYSSIHELMKAIDEESGTFETTTEQYQEILKGALKHVFKGKVDMLAQTISHEKEAVESFLDNSNRHALTNDPGNWNAAMLKIKDVIQKEQLLSRSP